MMNTSRRAFLRGTGVPVGLPWLEYVAAYSSPAYTLPKVVKEIPVGAAPKRNRSGMRRTHSLFGVAGCAGHRRRVSGYMGSGPPE